MAVCWYYCLQCSSAGTAPQGMSGKVRVRGYLLYMFNSPVTKLQRQPHNEHWHCYTARTHRAGVSVRRAGSAPHSVSSSMFDT